MKCLLLVLLAANVILVPSGVLEHARKFDRTNVTVLGTAENLAVHGVGPSTYFTQFQLCDSQCVNVINPGLPKIVNGQTATVNGTFYTFFLHGPVQLHDVVVVNPQ